MKLVCGLGNPGLKYKNTRHNIGFLVVDNFAKRNGFKINKRRFGSLFETVGIAHEQVAFLKPQSYMNNSGEPLEAAIKDMRISLSDILVVCDDINLMLGIIRLRIDGSSGGHKGLRSIIERLHTEHFNRLRAGIGLEKDAMLTDYVLSRFKRGEKRILKKVINMASDAIEVWIKEGIEAAMNGFNAKNIKEVE